MLEMIISHCVIAQMISIFSCCNACTESFLCKLQEKFIVAIETDKMMHNKANLT